MHSASLVVFAAAHALVTISFSREVEDEVSSTPDAWCAGRYGCAGGDSERDTVGPRCRRGLGCRRAASTRHPTGPRRLRPGLASDLAWLRTRPPLEGAPLALAQMGSAGGVSPGGAWAANLRGQGVPS